MDSKKTANETNGAPVKKLSLKRETVQRLRVQADIRTGMHNCQLTKLPDGSGGGGGGGGGSGGH